MSHITDVYREIVASIDDELTRKVYAAIFFASAADERIHLADIPAKVGLAGAKKTRERKVTKSIEILRRAGVTFVANNKGYKLSTDPDEIREQARVCRSKAATLEEIAHALDLSAARLEGYYKPPPQIQESLNL